jgi:ABC-2 type transport system permease protein
MSSFWAVFKRELKSYFTTPLAYVFLVIFLFFSGYLAFRDGLYAARQAHLTPFFMNLPLLLAIMASLTAMRLWAEERKIGSVELLFTLPVTITQAVLGKFFAAWLFLGIALALTFPMVMTITYLGDPDVGLIITGYLGAFLMAGGFLAIGSFFSALSKNQVIAAILSGVACALFMFAGMPSTLNSISGILPAGMVSAVEGMSLQTHFESMQKGVLQFGDLTYFIVLIAGWIAACAIILDERKAS